MTAPERGLNPAGRLLFFIERVRTVTEELALPSSEEQLSRYKVLAGVFGTKELPRTMRRLAGVVTLPGQLEEAIRSILPPNGDAAVFVKHIGEVNAKILMYASNLGSNDMQGHRYRDPFFLPDGAME